MTTDETAPAPTPAPDGVAPAPQTRSGRINGPFGGVNMAERYRRASHLHEILHALNTDAVWERIIAGRDEVLAIEGVTGVEPSLGRQSRHPVIEVVDDAHVAGALAAAQAILGDDVTARVVPEAERDLRRRLTERAADIAALPKSPRCSYRQEESGLVVYAHAPGGVPADTLAALEAIVGAPVEEYRVPFG